jgi:hypothetical protein
MIKVQVQLKMVKRDQIPTMVPIRIVRLALMSRITKVKTLKMSKKTGTE